MKQSGAELCHTILLDKLAFGLSIYIIQDPIVGVSWLTCDQKLQKKIIKYDNNCVLTKVVNKSYNKIYEQKL